MLRVILHLLWKVGEWYFTIHFLEYSISSICSWNWLKILPFMVPMQCKYMKSKHRLNDGGNIGCEHAEDTDINDSWWTANIRCPPVSPCYWFGGQEGYWDLRGIGKARSIKYTWFLLSCWMKCLLNYLPSNNKYDYSYRPVSYILQLAVTVANFNEKKSA